MGVVLAAMLGQIGLPGGGFAYALGAIAHDGKAAQRRAAPDAAAGPATASRAFIPVARIADMLLNPGAPFDYNGQRLTYPDIRLVYWAGGNPFHHHQDINRLRRAFATAGDDGRPRTGLDRHRPPRRHRAARHHDAGARGHRRRGHRPAADRHAPTRRPLTAKPATTTASSPTSPPGWDARRNSPKAAPRANGSRISTSHTRKRPRRARHRRPGFRRVLGSQGEFLLPSAPDDGGVLRAFRQDPIGAKLPTPSGRIEIHSANDRRASAIRTAPATRPGCRPTRRAGKPQRPLHLIANQPATRLHSQLDFGAHSAGP